MSWPMLDVHDASSGELPEGHVVADVCSEYVRAGLVTQHEVVCDGRAGHGAVAVLGDDQVVRRSRERLGVLRADHVRRRGREACERQQQAGGERGGHGCDEMRSFHVDPLPLS